jgi:hypothetical protein
LRITNTGEHRSPVFALVETAVLASGAADLRFAGIRSTTARLPLLKRKEIDNHSAAVVDFPK